jgi:hypothetical protein
VTELYNNKQGRLEEKERLFHPIASPVASKRHVFALIYIVVRHRNAKTGHELLHTKAKQRQQPFQVYGKGAWRLYFTEIELKNKGRGNDSDSASCPVSVASSLATSDVLR